MTPTTMAKPPPCGNHCPTAPQTPRLLRLCDTFQQKNCEDRPTGVHPRHTADLDQFAIDFVDVAPRSATDTGPGVEHPCVDRSTGELP